MSKCCFCLRHIDNRTVSIEKKQVELEERGVRVKLTIVDTPGFNEAINSENRYVASVLRWPYCKSQ